MDIDRKENRSEWVAHRDIKEGLEVIEVEEFGLGEWLTHNETKERDHGDSV